MATSELPGRLSIVMEFVNSINLEHGVDPLAGPDTLAGWCEDSGLCPNAGPEDLRRLRQFREALREVLEANAGDAEQAEAWSRLQPFAEHTCLTIRISKDAGPVLAPAGSGAEAAIAEIFAIVYDAVRTGSWPRVKACRKESCRWAFYDQSKNGSGAWCSMAVCGNRVKAQRRRARQKSD